MITIQQLKQRIITHRGEFFCRAIQKNELTKVCDFHHQITDPLPLKGIPDIGGLHEFYSELGSARFFYHDANNSARYLAPISEWQKLKEAFEDWHSDIDEDEWQEIDPEVAKWVHSCLVIGETPYSGNYILMPTVGKNIGKIFEFDHDGFEFYLYEDNILEYAYNIMLPNERRLLDYASMMRFRVSPSEDQWFIYEMRDNDGRYVSCESFLSKC